jgi:V/A-type H+/Na+-transporting ATPase subunit K
MNDSKNIFKKGVIGSVIFLFIAMAVTGTIFCSKVFAQETPKAEKAKTEAANAEAQAVLTPQKADVVKFGVLAAAIALGLAAIGAGYAISHVGAAAMAAIAEKPQIFGQALIFVALAEGLVVFGFITALMILGRV